LNAAVDNVQEVTERLRPIVNDVRVFTDKIARDPRQLGVRGALDRRPTGLKAGINLD
jgi:phospholipid/cholesterol/gamma-HCH transport system substrate-binding protein